MQVNELSRMYFVATSFIAQATTELYESLHDEHGEPIQDQDTVKLLVDNYVKRVRVEAELVRSAIRQHIEGM